MMCDDDASTTKRWTPLGPPDEFDVADATVPVSWVLATRGATGGTPGGGIEGVVGALLIVELGSLGFYGKHDGGAVGRNTRRKIMVHPPTKYLYRLNRGRGTRWWCQN